MIGLRPAAATGAPAAQDGDAKASGSEPGPSPAPEASAADPEDTPEPTPEPAPRTVETAPRRRFRLHSEIQPLGFTHVNPETASLTATDLFAPMGASNPGAASTNTVGVGLGRLRYLDASLPIWSVGLGVVVGDHLLAGVRTGVYWNRGHNPDGDTISRGSAAKLVPYLQYVFARSGRITPYVEARFGLTASRAVTKTRGEAARKTTVRSLGPVAGIGGGVYLAITRSLSLNVGLDLDYHAPFSRTSVVSDDSETRTDWEKSADIVDLGVSLGLSVWFG